MKLLESTTAFNFVPAWSQALNQHRYKKVQFDYAKLSHL